MLRDANYALDGPAVDVTVGHFLSRAAANQHVHSLALCCILLITVKRLTDLASACLYESARISTQQASIKREVTRCGRRKIIER